MSNFSFWLLVELIILANVAFAGVALFYWAKPISERYNAWTIRFRKRYPQISKPVTPESVLLNYKIMFIFFRVVGALLFMETVYLSVRAINRIPR